MTKTLKLIAISVIALAVAGSPAAWAKTHHVTKQQYRPIAGLDDSKPLPGPHGMMRQILDIMENGGSIRDLKPVKKPKA